MKMALKYGCRMVRARRAGLMVYSMKVLGMKDNYEVMAGWYMPIQMYMKESFRIIKRMVMAN